MSENCPLQAANVNDLPETAFPVSSVGVSIVVSAPWPARQFSEYPQVRTLPSGVMAKELSMPAATRVAVIPATGVSYSCECSDERR